MPSSQQLDHPTSRQPKTMRIGRGRDPESIPLVNAARGPKLDGPIRFNFGHRVAEGYRVRPPVPSHYGQAIAAVHTPLREPILCREALEALNDRDESQRKHVPLRISFRRVEPRAYSQDILKLRQKSPPSTIISGKWRTNLHRSAAVHATQESRMKNNTIIL